MTRAGLALVLAAGCVTAHAAKQLAVSDETRAAAEQAGKLMRECRYDDAEALVAARMNGASPADRRLLLLSAGTLAEHRGDAAKALRHYEEASAGDQVPVQALRLLGRAQIANRQFVEGEKSLMAYVNHQLKVLKLAPSDEDLAALAVAEAEQGRPEEALKLLDLVMAQVSAYDPLIISLRAKMQAVKDSGAVPAPGVYWTHAYGGEHSIGMTTDDFSPQPLKRTSPLYPRMALRDGVQGRVVLLLKVDAAGNVTGVKVIKSRPFKVFDEAARAAVREWKFVPRVHNCRPVPTEAIQQIDFRMEED